MKMYEAKSAAKKSTVFNSIVITLLLLSLLFTPSTQAAIPKEEPIDGEVENIHYEENITYVVNISMEQPANYTLYVPMLVDWNGSVSEAFSQGNLTVTGNATFEIINVTHNSTQGFMLNITGYGNFTLETFYHYEGDDASPINFNNLNLSLWFINENFSPNVRMWPSQWEYRPIWMYYNGTQEITKLNVFFTCHSKEIVTYENGAVRIDYPLRGGSGFYCDNSACLNKGWNVVYGGKGRIYADSELRYPEDDSSSFLPSFLPAFTIPALLLAAAASALILRKRRGKSS